jgi:hypothetical protein
LGQDTTNYYKIGRNTSTGFLDFNGTQTGYVGYTFSGGNVAIGTTSPVTALTVKGTSGAIAPSLSANAGAFTINNGGDLQLQFGEASGSPALYMQGKRVSNDGSSWPIALNPAGGNVGIGTTSPNALLTIGPALGGTALGSTFTTNAGALGTTAGNTLNLANIGFTSSNQTSLGIQALRMTSGSNWTTSAIGLLYDVDNSSPVNNVQIWLTSTGNVGIGTTGPQATLDVNGKISTPHVGNNSGNLLIDTAGNAGDITIGNSNIVVKAGGYVGIGTTGPGVTLDVNGNVRPGRTGVSTGGACTGEGSFGYDATAHAPVYCNQSSVWAAVGGGGAPLAVMYLDVYSGLPGPAACPSGWTQADFELIYLGSYETNRRTCIGPSSDVHQVMYLDGEAGVVVPAACPSGWTEADYRQSGGDYHRTCYY